MKLVYRSFRPKVAIRCDKYQWILSTSFRKRKDEKGDGYDYCDPQYFSNISHLLDELFEILTRKYSKYADDLTGIETGVMKAYKYIAKISKKLEVQRE